MFPSEVQLLKENNMQIYCQKRLYELPHSLHLRMYDYFAFEDAPEEVIKKKLRSKITNVNKYITLKSRYRCNKTF